MKKSTMVEFYERDEQRHGHGFSVKRLVINSWKESLTKDLLLKFFFMSLTLFAYFNMDDHITAYTATVLFWFFETIISHLRAIQINLLKRLNELSL